ncbi:hypothetical protein Clacol_010380 [Clathrus columnatus]|uniref:Uncharacterized protein n=1 Tax=Clathrus columnatus TaxID=1419009 RepID=A0AAV5AUV5_9AGAM|nr:hypothetical protein Clacol_010380 [Clathrus columnatus]
MDGLVSPEYLRDDWLIAGCATISSHDAPPLLVLDYEFKTAATMGNIDRLDAYKIQFYLQNLKVSLDSARAVKDQYK